MPGAAAAVPAAPPSKRAHVTAATQAPNELPPCFSQMRALPAGGAMELLGVQFERDVIAKLFDGDPSLHMWVRLC